jgi:hypothetical protein
MRRVGLVVAAVCGVIVAAAGGTASAAVPGAGLGKAPAPSGSAGAGTPAPGAGQAICTVSDSRLQEISGLAAVDTGYLAINDSNPDPSQMRIYRLDNQCKVTGTTAYPSDARDPEDVAVAPDGTIWVADTGDNDAKRTTVALWKMGPNERTPVIHRLTYPDGAKDAEAILLGGDGIPIIVTREAGKPGLYVPSAPLVPRSNTGVALKRVGQFDLPASQTSNPLGQIGRSVVSGGATAPDGKRVVLRTYADAMEWDVPDGDVVKAVTSTKPRVTPLPNEPQGESITYSRDGKSFITVSEVTAGRSAALLRYTPAAAPAAVQTAAGGGKAADDEGSFTSNLTIDDITYLVAAVGVLGLLLVVIGVVAIRRSRAARRAAVRAGGAATGAAAAGGRNGPGGPGGPGGARGAAGAGRASVRANSFDDFDDFDDPPTRGRASVRGGAASGGAAGARGPRGGGGPGGAADRTGAVYRTGDIRGEMRSGEIRPGGEMRSGEIRTGDGRTGGVYGRREPAVAADTGWPDEDDDPRGYGRR